MPDPRAKDLFLQALELPEPERAGFVERLASTDARLAAQVEELLRAHGGAAAAALEDVPRSIGTNLGGLWGEPGLCLGDYELLEEVGSGAFGAVWRARQVPLGRIVALKVLRAGRLAGARDLERLRAEAEAVARLDHPHIVPVHEIGEHDGHPYFSMKWIEGGTLAQRLDRPWPARQAARVLVDVARAVHHAHQRGLLHRDLKPSNVLLDAEGRPHVADFGIAKRLDGEGGATTTQALAGTPAYMAPEQAGGGELTVATDVWALGCILYELLAGRAAFGGRSVTDTLRKILREEPVPLRELRPELPRDLETIVLVALRKEPARRYASADALAEDLERWLAHEPIAARRTRTWERLALFCRRSPLAASLIGLVLGLVLLLAVVATWASVELGARLRESYLGQARATRLSSALGARTEALELLRRAATIRPGADLCDEAIACLALTDLTRERVIERPRGLDEHVVPDPAFRRLAVADEGGLRILDFADGSELAVLGPVNDLGYLAWSQGGRWLFSKHGAGGQETGLCVWDVEAGAEHLARAEAVASRAADFAPDDRRLAYGTVAGELVVLALPGGEERLRRALGGRPTALAFDPSGARVAVALGEDEKRLCVLDAQTGESLHEAAIPAPAFALCWTGDGRGLAVACADSRTHVYEAEGLAPRAVCQGHSAEVVDVFASAVAPLVSTYSWDETTRLWDATTGREIRRASGRVLGFAPDGLHLAMMDARSWSAWRLEHGVFLRTLQAHRGKSPRDLAFAPDGHGLASAGPDGVYYWDGRAGSEPRPIHGEETRAVRFLDGGRTLLSSGATGLWRVALEPPGAPEHLLPGALLSLALSADGRTLAVQTRNTLRLLDPGAPDSVRALPGAEGLEFLSISADGTRVAAGNWRGHGVRVWDLRAGGEPRLFLPEQVNVAAALAPDGERLATASSERLEVWDVASGARLFAAERQRLFGNAPAPVAFSADGAWLAFALTNEIVRLIDARTFASRATLEAPQLEAVSELAFSPDGSVLAVACCTNRVQLWDLVALERELDALGVAER